MREVIVSPTVLGKLSDLVSCLKDDIKLSEEAAQAYRGRFVQFIRTRSITLYADSSGGANWATVVRYSKNIGF